MDANSFRDFQQKYQSEAKAVQALEEKLSKLRAPSAKLMSQVRENEMVQTELNLLEDDNAVYKLMGPVMVKQELSDVKMNVSNRLKYLHGELERIEAEAKTIQEQQEKHQKNLVDMTNFIRRIQREAAEKAAANKE